ncbi:hypothetical protein [Streptomyces luteogriseus]|uniref:hypothetical protein n=1 Tax=Streptomyces luteogriseus TaxID=68233 RepID=UPI0037904A94
MTTFSTLDQWLLGPGILFLGAGLGALLNADKTKEFRAAVRFIVAGLGLIISGVITHGS